MSVACSLSDKNITEIAEDAFTSVPNIERLILSNNKLRAIGPEFSVLKRLAMIDFRDNTLQKPVKYLAHLPPTVEEIVLEGNPLSLSDKILAVELLPNLILLDGKKCKEYRKEIDDMKAQLDAKLDHAWLKAKFSDRIRTSLADDFKPDILVRECVRQVKREVKYPENMQAVLNHLLELKVAVKIDYEYNRFGGNRRRNVRALHDETETDAAEGKPIKAAGDQGPTSGKKAKAPKKARKRVRVEVESDLDYDPKLFLRAHCHMNDARDNGTQIWKAAFRPNTGPDDKRNMVATCGGNTICLIDCDKLVVESRYTDRNPTENFYCLAWTVITDDATGDEEVILAAAGNVHKIVIFSDTKNEYRLSCVFRFHAHEADVNCIMFHPTRTHWMFTASYDRTVKLWSIAKHERLDDIEPLVTIDTNNELLTLCYSQMFDCLLAGGERGMTVWQNVTVNVE